MHKKGYLLDLSIILLCRAIRSFFLGIFAFVFMESIILRGLSFANVSNLQISIMVGCVLTSKLIIKLAKAVGVVNALMLASLFKCAATFAFAHAKGVSALSTAAIFGCFAIYGEWSCPFLELERAALAQLAKGRTQEESQTQPSKLISFHKALGKITQAGGMIAAAKFLHYYNYVNLIEAKQSGDMMLAYCAFSAFACMVLYAMLDRSKIQANVNVGTKTHSGEKEGLLPSAIFCLEGIYASIFSQAYIIYLLRMRYQNFYADIFPSMVLFLYCQIAGSIVYVLLRRSRINGVPLYLFTSVLPNLLVIISGFILVYQDAVRILFLPIIFFGSAAYSERPSLIVKLFPGAKEASINWLVTAGYLIGGVIGFMLQQRFEMAGLPIIAAGASRLLVDAIILASYARRREEIGPFGSLMQEERLGGPQDSTREVASHEAI